MLFLQKSGKGRPWLAIKTNPEGQHLGKNYRFKYRSLAYWRGLTRFGGKQVIRGHSMTTARAKPRWRGI